jgi:hypothetical protein
MIGLGTISAIITTAVLVHDYRPKSKTMSIGVATIAIVPVILAIASWTIEVWNHQSQIDAQFRISEQPIVTIGKPDGTIAEMVNGHLKLYFHNTGHLPALRFNVGFLGLKNKPFHRITRSKNKSGGENTSGGGEATIAGGDIYPLEISLTPDEISSFSKPGIFTLPFGYYEYCDRFGDYTCKGFDLWSDIHLEHFGIMAQEDCMAVMTAIPPPTADEVFLSPCKNLEEAPSN